MLTLLTSENHKYTDLGAILTPQRHFLELTLSTVFGYISGDTVCMRLLALASGKRSKRVLWPLTGQAWILNTMYVISK